MLFFIRLDFLSQSLFSLHFKWFNVDFIQPNKFEQLANHQLAIQIDRQYDFEQIQEALDYVAKGHAKGKVIVKI